MNSMWQSSIGGTHISQWGTIWEFVNPGFYLNGTIIKEQISNSGTLQWNEDIHSFEESWMANIRRTRGKPNVGYMEFWDVGWV
jgi:hypothetical protein